MSENNPVLQLQMVWPEYLLESPPKVIMPPGYRLRTFQPGDEPQILRLMALVGWPDWQLEFWQAAILAGCWFLTVETKSDKIVASAMGLHDPKDPNPVGSELSWVAGDPAHRGQGLGRAVCAAVTGRLIEAGYRDIHLFTDDWRVPAIKVYLKMGYTPLLFNSEMVERWQAICAQLNWPFTPEKWQTTRT